MKNQAEIDKLVLENQGLIWKVIQDHFKQINNKSQTTYQDLYQYGNIGIIKAAKKYKPSIGKFSTFAYYRILGEISSFVRRHKIKDRLRTDSPTQLWDSKQAHEVERVLNGVTNPPDHEYEDLNHHLKMKIIKLPNISNHDKYFFMSYYGLIEPKRNYLELAKMSGISKQRVCASVHHVMKKLRRSMKNDKHKYL